MSGALTDTSILAGASQAAGYDIDYSCRFNDGDKAFLSRTFPGAGNRKTWTLSLWAKRAKLGDTQALFNAWEDDSNRFGFYWNDSDKLYVYEMTSNSTSWEVTSDAVYRDPGAWAHIVLVRDATNGTAAARTKIYVNGSQVDLTQATSLSDVDGIVNKAILHNIGREKHSTGTYESLDSYLADVYFIDGLALTPTSFAETDVLTNEWKPIDASDLTFGTNGFYLKFDNSTGGSSFTDSSSSAHTITPEGPSSGAPSVWNSPAQKKIGNSSIKFTGGYLRVADSAQWALANDWTFEAWVYCTQDPASGGGLNTYLWGQYDSDPSNAGCVIISYGSSGRADFIINNYAGYFRADNIGLTQNNWHHVAFCKSVATGTNYVFVDGNSKTVSVSGTPGPIGNYSAGPCIGAGDHSGSPGAYLFQGYMDEFRVSGIARYTAAFTPQTTAFVNDSDTKLLIHSNFDGTGLGTDSSGNVNNFGPIALSATDQMVDTPTNNFGTFNPLIGYAASGARMSYTDLSEGNLKAVGNYASETGIAPGSFSFGTGKWYVEFVATSLSGAYPHLGIIETTSCTAQGGYATNSVMYKADGGKVQNSTNTGGVGDSWVAGDVIGMAIDCTNGAVYFAKNNTWQNSGDPTSGASKTGAFMTWTGESIDFVTTTSPYTTSAGVVMNNGQDSSFAGEKTAQGNSDSGTATTDFYYTPPTNFLALCTDNLADPSIALPAEHFNSVLWTGDAANPRTITGVGFESDMTWLKSRSQISAHQVFDQVRGAEKVIYPNTTAIEAGADANGTISAWTSDGFTLSGSSTNNDLNGNTYTYVAWNWLAATTFDPADDGTIVTASGRSNAAAGFSIVKYTGTGVNTTVGHGLASAPTLVIVKDLDTGGTSWITGGKDIHSDFEGYLELNDSGTGANSATVFQDTPPDASVFSIGSHTHTNDSGDEIIAYCFAPIEGYSKVGKYTGNVNADGTFAYLGFRPAMILIKGLGYSSDWHIFDNKRIGYNVKNYDLTPNETVAEITDARIDFLSNGFKIRTTAANINSGGNELMYYAISEYPFKYSNAR